MRKDAKRTQKTGIVKNIIIRKTDIHDIIKEEAPHAESKGSKGSFFTWAIHILNRIIGKTVLMHTTEIAKQTVLVNSRLHINIFFKRLILDMITKDTDTNIFQSTPMVFDAPKSL